MSRIIAGLNAAANSAKQPADGEYLVRGARAQYHGDKRKPYYSIWFQILEPARATHKAFVARIYCSPKALWKLNWFLKGFGYDSELLGKNELDEKALVGLKGVVKISQIVVNGGVVLNLDGFSRSENWPDVSDQEAQSEVA